MTPQQLPRGKDGLFVEPKASGPDREKVEQQHRDAFAEHFSFADPFTGDADSYDENGRYNCGRCKQVDATNCALLAIPKVDREGGSCGDWEKPGEAVIVLHAKPPAMASYGVAANGTGFGCKRCPFASKAKAPDSKGRTLYCGKGDFRTFENACCSINGAELVPSESRSQHNLMEMVEHDPKAAARTGIPGSVARDYVEADKGRDLPKKVDKAKKAAPVFGALG